jgi:hypothetical protein
VEGSVEIKVEQSQAERHAASAHPTAARILGGVGPADDDVLAGGWEMDASEGVAVAVFRDLSSPTTVLTLRRSTANAAAAAAACTSR